MNHLRLVRPLLSAPVCGASSLPFSTSSHLLLPPTAKSGSKLIPASRVALKTSAASEEASPAKKKSARSSPPPPAPTPAAPRKRSSKVILKSEEDSSDDDDDEVPAKKAPAKRAPAKKAAVSPKAAAPKAASPAKPKASRKKAVKAEKLPKPLPETNLPLLDVIPTRSVLSSLKKGIVTEPKPHWVPVPKVPVSPYTTIFSKRANDLSKAWHEMPEQEKEKYTKLSQEDEKRFQKEVAEYFAKRTPEQFYLQKLPPHIASLDPLRIPKLPPNPYSLFVAQNSKDQATSDLKVIAEKWKTLKEEDKKEFNEAAQAAQIAYQKVWREHKTKIPPFPQDI